jgi:hypothetical protein
MFQDKILDINITAMDNDQIPLMDQQFWVAGHMDPIQIPLVLTCKDPGLYATANHFLGHVLDIVLRSTWIGGIPMHTK